MSTKLQRTIIILCIASILASAIGSVPAPVTANAQAGDAPQRSRSNHDTQTKVSGPHGMRINTWNGNLFLPVELLSIPGRRLPLELVISYNSGWHDFATRYGHGWQLNHNIFYSREENGDIVIVWDDGRTDRFVASGGSFLPPLDVYDSFQEYQPTKYVLRTKDGFEFYFDSPIHKRITKIQEPNGNALIFAYDSGMLLTGITDMTGRLIRLSYNNGNLTTITDANTLPNRLIQLRYDGNNNLVSITDALGNTTGYGYDASHLLMSITPPRGVPANITYTSNNAVASIADATTNKSFQYSNLIVDPGPWLDVTDVIDIIEGQKQVTRYFYNANDGRISSIVTGLDRTLGDAGNGSNGAAGFRVSMTWDDNNNLTSFTDANNNVTHYSYDERGNLVAVIDALGHTTRYTYDSTYNRLTSITDANSHKTRFDYDERGNLVREIDPLGNATNYVYDSQGNLISHTDANGQTTSYEYNEHGDLITIIAPSGEVVRNGYDSVGNLTGMSNTDVSILYQSDPLNRVTNVDYASHGKSFGYTYDEFGNRTSMTWPEGGKTFYEYDGANQLIKLINPLGEVTRYTYDSGGRLVRKDLHNGTYAEYNYDQVNRLLSLVNKKSSSEVISSYTYEYDAVGNRIKMTEADGGVTTYTYDALNRLTKATYPGGSFQEFTYDAVGNRLSLRDAAGITRYTYDAADRLQKAGATTYAWNKNGGLIRKTDKDGITTYDYDFDDRLKSITFPDSNANLFSYYPDGRRLSKTNKSGETTSLFYDGPNAILETTDTGTAIARYTSGLGIDDWISMDRNGSSYYHQDGLGSVIGLTNSSQVLLATYRYDAFGIISNQAGSLANPYQFAGRESDIDSQLYFYRARYYDSKLGRFISKDPLGTFLIQPNSYSYVSANPVNFIDPEGLEQTPPLTLFQRFVNKHVKIVIPKLGRIFSIGYGWYQKNTRGWHWQFLFFNHIPVRGTAIAAVFTAVFLCALLCFPTEVEPGLISNGVNTGPFGEGGESPGGDGGTGGGGGKGPESKSLNVVPSVFLGEATLTSTIVQPIQAAPLINLRDIIPNIGPDGTVATPVTPSFPLNGATNAVDAAATDFVDANSAIRASVFATKTIDRTYEHDYAICNRFHGYTLHSVAALPLPGLLPGMTESPWFWYTSNTTNQFVEETYIFVVFVNEGQKTFTVDSRWITDQYSPPPATTYDYIFNFQTFASSSEEAYKLVQRTASNLANFGTGWTVNFANTTEPPKPTVVIKSTELAGKTLKMAVQSWLPTTQTVRFFGTLRRPTDRTTDIPFEYERILQPGYNVVELPLGNILDAVVQVLNSDFLDRVYVGSGFWFTFDDSADGGTSNVTLSLPTSCNPATNLTEADLTLGECAQMAGAVATGGGYVGMARTINPNGLPIDISQYKALAFFAKGDGKSYRVSLETESVGKLGSTDFHQFVFTASPEGRQYIIPLSSFAQRGSDNLVPFTGRDVKAVVWTSVGGPHEAVSLTINGAAFVNSTIIAATTLLPNTAGVAGPYTVTTRISDDIGISVANLLYSVNGGQTFNRIPMVASGNTFRASIPGQPLGTEVKYYVEAKDTHGNVATNPVDVPYTTYRFQVSDRPHLLVDDFSDTNPANVLGGDSWLFGSETGGQILAFYQNGHLQLKFDVSTPDSFAGYATQLNKANLTPHDVLIISIKGNTGGEKVLVGLRDSVGNEPKVNLNDYLPGGISTSWQKVAIPLMAFKGIVGWSSIERFTLAFENKIGSGAGAIEVDDVKIGRWLGPKPNFLNTINSPKSLRPIIDWGNVNGASSYTLQIAKDPNFTKLVLNLNLTPSAYIPTVDLPKGITLFWRVRANGSKGPGEWSRVRHFDSPNPPSVPTLLMPAHNATLANGQPTLDWSDSSPGVDHYEVQISTNSTFTAVLGRGRGGRTGASQYTLEAALGTGVYYWRVRAVNAQGQFSQWSAARSFNVP